MDVAVIGSGFAGLSASLALAKDGLNVTVYERHDQVGGRAMQVLFDDELFDAGPSWYWMPEVFEKIFELGDASTSDFYNLTRLDPAYTMHTPFGSLPVPGQGADFEKMLCETMQTSCDVLLEAKEKYDFAMQELWKEPSPWNLISPSYIRTLLRTSIFKSLTKHIEAHTKNEWAKLLLSWPSIFVGCAPDASPSLYSIMSYAGHIGGTFYPSGGMSSPAKALRTLAEARGVRFRFGETVTSLRAHGDRVSHVCSNDVCTPFDGVVAAGDYAKMESLLPFHLRRYTEQFWIHQTFSPTCVVFLVRLVDPVDLGHHTFVVENTSFTDVLSDEPLDTTFPFYVSYPHASGGEDARNVFLLIPVGHNNRHWNQSNAFFMDTVVRRLAARTGVALKVKSYMRLDPDYFEKTFFATRGNAFGLANTLDQSLFLKPSMRSRARNVVFAGHMTSPGPGVPPALISGVVAANILKHNLRPTPNAVDVIVALLLTIVLAIIIDFLVRASKYVHSKRDAVDLWRCIRTMEIHGKTYFAGALSLSWEQLFDTASVYAFMRVADDLVDSEEPPHVRLACIHAFKNTFEAVLARGETAAVGHGSFAMRMMARCCARRGMDTNSLSRFFAAMISDAAPSNVMKTHADMMKYMDGSAALMGEVMLCVLCEKNVKTAEMVLCARSLGNAFQTTNFVRDVAEDAKMNRVYIPVEICEQHGVDLLKATRATSEVVHLLEDAMSLTDSWYREAERGVDILPESAQFSIRASLRMYRSIHDEIRRSGYDVFSRRARVPTLHKIRVMSGIPGFQKSVCRILAKLFLWKLMSATKFLGWTATFAAAASVQGHAVSMFTGPLPTYWEYHLAFSLVPCVIFSVVATKMDWMLCGLMCAVATASTIPWEFVVLSYYRMWEYGPGVVSSFVGGIPVEEIAFFGFTVVYTYVFWMFYEGRNAVSERVQGCGATLTFNALSIVSGICASVLPVCLLFRENSLNTNFGYAAALVCSFPVLTLQYIVGKRVLSSRRHVWIRSVLSTWLYLLVGEKWAIERNMWRVNRSVGSVFDIPVEEVVFYFLVCLMSTWGIVLSHSFFAVQGNKKWSAASVLESPSSVLRSAIASQRVPSAMVMHVDAMLQQVIGGRQSRFKFFASVLEDLSAHAVIIPESRVLSAMGCALEVWHSSLLIFDDIMDCSSVRRGLPTWHVKKGVAVAMNDALILQQYVYDLIHAVLDADTFYRVMHIWTDVAVDSGYGQFLDLNPVAWEQMDELSHLQTSHLKTALYSFYLPFALACEITGLSKFTRDKRLMDVTSTCGVLYQQLDDFKDVFEDEETLLKSKRDIEERRCTWVTCFARASLPDDERDRFGAAMSPGKRENAVNILLRNNVHVRLKDVYREKQLALKDSAVGCIIERSILKVCESADIDRVVMIQAAPS
jgi:phytoene desaturase